MKLLLHWNTRINLIGPGTVDQVMERHVDDSLQLIDLLPSCGRIADLGSGAGFPGLIVSLASGRPVILVEADLRKASFLREAARATGACATIVAARIEQSGLTDIDIILARALAPLPRLLELSHPIMAEDGVAFFLKGAQLGRELTDAEGRWQMTATRHPSRTTQDGCVLEVRHLRHRPQHG